MITKPTTIFKSTLPLLICLQIKKKKNQTNTNKIKEFCNLCKDNQKKKSKNKSKKQYNNNNEHVTSFA